MAQAKLPHQKMRFRLCMITALMKLGNYEQASGEFKDIGTTHPLLSVYQFSGLFDEARYLCESFPENYPGKTGTPRVKLTTNSSVFRFSDTISYETPIC